MRKSHFNDEFLVLLGPKISRFFASSNDEKKSTKTTKGACSSPISRLTTNPPQVSFKLQSHKKMFKVSNVTELLNFTHETFQRRLKCLSGFGQDYGTKGLESLGV